MAHVQFNGTWCLEIVALELLSMTFHAPFSCQVLPAMLENRLCIHLSEKQKRLSYVTSSNLNMGRFVQTKKGTVGLLF